MNDITEKKDLNKFSNFITIIENIPNIFEKVGRFFLEHQKEIEYIFSQFPQDIQDTIDMLADFEWTLYRQLSFLNIFDFIKIYKMDINKAKKKSKIDSLIISSLSNNEVNKIIDKIISTTKCISRCRCSIIEEMRFAYNHKKYYSANCLLITLIEGVIISNDKDITWASHSQLKTSVQIKMDEYCKVLTYRVFEKHFYSKFNLIDKEVNSSISRDAILHGYDTHFGNEVVFLKLLLLFADISEVLFRYKATELKRTT